MTLDEIEAVISAYGLSVNRLSILTPDRRTKLTPPRLSKQQGVFKVTKPGGSILDADQQSMRCAGRSSR